MLNICLFRYCDYYYGEETGLYYLQSRYYDPNTGRFINGDMPEFMLLSNTPHGHNLYAYCENEPVNNVDPFGYEAIATAISLAVLKEALIVAVGYMVVAIILCVVVYYLSQSTVLEDTSRELSKLGNTIRSKWKWLTSKIGAILKAISTAIAISKVANQIQFSKRTKIPTKLKSGKKVKTPTSHSGEFSKNKDGSYTHKKTKWKMEKAKDKHYNGEHWHLSPKNGKTGDYYNIGPNGNVLS